MAGGAASSQSVHIAPDRRRFVVLAVFVAFGLGNQFQNVGNAIIADELTEYLGCSKFQVNMLIALCMVVYVLGAFAGVQAVHHIGLRWGLVFGLVVTALGAVLKLIAVTATRSYWLLFTGQLWAALGQFAFQGLPPLLAAMWFPVSERSTATAFGTLAIFVGNALGYSIPAAVVNDSHKSEADFGTLYGAVAAFCVVSCVCGVFLPTQPKHPPSVTSPQYAVVARLDFPQSDLSATGSAEKQRHDPNAPLLRSSTSPTVEFGSDADIERAAPDHVLQQLWAQRHNTSFVWIVLGNGTANSINNAILSVLSQLMKPFGVGETATGNAMLVAFLTGAATSVVIAASLDKYRRYKRVLIALYIAALVTVASWLLTMKYVDGGPDTFKPVTIIGTLALVLSLQSTVPVGIEFAVEVSYPMPEAISGTAIMWITSVLGAISLVVVSSVFGNDATRSDSVHVLTASCVAVLCALLTTILFVKEDLRRQAAEHEHFASYGAAELSPRQERTAGPMDGNDVDMVVRES